MTSYILIKIREVANRFSKYQKIKKLVAPLYRKLIITPLLNVKKYYFRKNAMCVIREFHNCLCENNIKYTLSFGTLLGAIREGGFIKHDLDIDVSIWANEYSPRIKESLSAKGFKLAHSFTIDNGNYGREETYELKGVSIDIFYLYTDENGHSYCCDFMPANGTPSFRESMKKHNSCLARKIIIPVSKDRCLQNFESEKLFIPANAHEILRLRYGDDYMIPNPKWTMSSHNPNIQPLPHKCAIYSEYHSKQNRGS